MKSFVQRAFESSGLDVFSYSGRGMNNVQSLAVRAENINQVIESLLFGVAEFGVDSFLFAANRMEIDSLGFDIVAYFPGMEFVDDDDQGEDD